MDKKLASIYILCERRYKSDLSKNRKEQERTRLDKEIALFNKKMILYLYFSYTDNISCYGLIINEYDITDDK